MVKAVGDAVASCKPPHVFGIHGDWGCGKTSFLCQLSLYLSGLCPCIGVDWDSGRGKAAKLWGSWKPKDNVAVVWYEAWRYQHETVPIVALLHEIREQLNFWARAKSFAGKTADVTVRSAIRGFGSLTKAVGGEAFDPDKNTQYGKAYESERFLDPLPSDALREQLEYELGRVLKRGEEVEDGAPRLVVLIDDLDRCEPEAAFRLLEGIKVYLTLKNCVFVLAMDHSVICDHIAARACPGDRDEESEETKRNKARAKDYLEKICKDVWHLPIPTNQTELLHRFLDKMIQNKAIISSMIQIVDDSPCLPANPRKFKAFANILVRYLTYLGYDLTVGSTAPDERQAKLIVIMAYLYQFHHNLYRLIEADPAFYEVIVRWAGDKDAVTHSAFTNLDEVLVAGSDESAYPDPVLGDFLRVQKLIKSLQDVRPLEIGEYLLDQPRPKASPKAKQSVVTGKKTRKHGPKK
jgi:hypothetical protein